MKAEIALQGENVGGLRYRHFEGNLCSPRTSRVIMGVDPFGQTVYIPLSILNLDAGTLPHLSRGTAKLFDQPDQRSLDSTLHRKTTTSGYPINRDDYRPEKRGGFGSDFERRALAKLREAKKLKRELLKAGIDEHKLSLLIHSFLHLQTHYETEVPVKALPSYKKKGFGSANEVKIMERQRRRNNQALAPPWKYL